MGLLCTVKVYLKGPAKDDTALEDWRSPRVRAGKGVSSENEESAP